MNFTHKKSLLFVLLTFVIILETSAQLGFCTGNSGAPIFVEDFGIAPSATTQHVPLPAPGTTTYTFLGNPPAVFADGRYTVSNMNYQQWNWFNEEDHTPGDTNGRMLVVNASFTPGEFYRLPITGLCENTTYTFSSWIKNLTPRDLINAGRTPNPCNVRFEIWDSTDTILLKSGNTGDFFGALSTENGVWLQSVLLFQTQPGQNAVILKMVNNGIGGYGNDLAIDDIEFKSCGDSIEIEDPTKSNNISICSTQTPYSTTISAVPDNVVFSSHFYQWQRSIDNGVTWADIVGETASSLAITGLIATTHYRAKVAESAVNVNNGSCNTISDVFQITVNPTIIPTFNAIAPICSGETLAALPTTSTNSITGTWSPALNNTTTTLYTFTPDAGQCAPTENLTITVNPIVTPTFNAVAPICNGETLTALPTTSNNSVTGTWSPALNNTATTLYTFTPDAGQCAPTENLTITVNPIVIPNFNAVAPICSGETLAPLPTTSNNSITGTWSPAIDNTATTLYTFTPDAGQCAPTENLTITVNPIITPTFNAVAPICSGETLAALPTTSNNSITGTWSPALDNTTTTLYTFTPDTGQCATTEDLTIIVNPSVTPTFNTVAPICAGETLAALPTTSNNSITGTWSPALDNTATTLYTFTPDVGQCAPTENLTITVNPIVIPNFNAVAPICSGETLAPLPTTSTNSITGTWSPAIDNTATTLYTFTPDAGQCATTEDLTITVNSGVSAMFNPVAPICEGDTITALPITSNNSITGTWSPALDNTATTTYTFTPDPGFCPLPVTLTIQVNQKPTLNLDANYTLCIDSSGIPTSPLTLLDSGLTTPNYEFTWYLDTVEIIGANQGSYSPTTGGIYTVQVRDVSTTCSNIASTRVTGITAPVLTANVTTQAFSENQIIEAMVTGTGDYEFKLDNNPWQVTSIFTNVSSGEHTVYVNDKLGCGTDQVTVSVIGYPKFFTPNGDTTNETWNITALNSAANAKIYIFNRYGKLLKQINPTGSGWDGTINGVQMPTGDYWFLLEYNEPTTGNRKEFKSHFTLKR